MKMMKNNDLLKRCLWTMLLVAIYGLGQRIPLPMIDATVARHYLAGNNFLQILGATTGGQSTIPTLLTLGIMPYMTSMIVWQAINAMDLQVINNLSQKRIGVIRNFIALMFCLLQSILYVYYVRTALVPVFFLWGQTDVSFPSAVLMLTAGGMLAIAIANFNSDHGIGGQVAVMLPGLLLTLPYMLNKGWGSTTFALTPVHLAIAIVIILVFIPLGVWLNQAELHLHVQRPMLDSSYGESYMPIRFLTAGPMPFMFSSMLFTLPQMLISGTSFASTSVGTEVTLWTTSTKVQGIITYAVIVVALGYAFGLMNFQPSKTARTLKESGDYFYNITPGDDTEHYLMRHFNRLSLPGGLVLMAIGSLHLSLGYMFLELATSLLFWGTFLS